MTSPILYDFRRTLTSKSVLIIMAIMILISFAIIPFISISVGGGGFNSSPPQVLAYHDSAGYHFVTYSTNQFGQAVGGYAIDLNLTYNGQAHNGGGTTNSSGFAAFLIQAPSNPNYTASIKVVNPGGNLAEEINGSGPLFSQYVNGTLSPVSDGDVVSVLGGTGLETIPDARNSSINDLSLFYLAPFGKVPSGYSLYYKLFNGTAGESFSFGKFYNQSKMQLLGTLNGYVTTFSPPVVPSGYNSGSYFIFELFYPNGTVVTQIPPRPFFVDDLYIPPAPPVNPTNAASQFFQGIFGFFIPLMAIIGSYTSYGKDRVTGVLESVLSKPVTRRGLSISRFLSTFGAMAVAVVIAVAVVDAIAYYFTRAFIDSTFLISSTVGFLVGLAAFVGIMLFLAHLVKGSGALIGIGIALFILFDFFWSVIILGIAYLLRVGFGTATYYQISTVLQFLNPSQYVSLIGTYLTGQSTFGFITPSEYGITIPSLVAAAVLWIAVPFAIFVYLATKRD